MLLSLALDDYLDAKTMRHNPTTNKWYAHKLNVFLAFCNEQNVTDTDSLAPATVRAFLWHLRTRTNRNGQPLASKTLHCYLKVLSAFLHWLVRESIVPERVATLEFPTLEKKVVQTFTEEQVAALLKACQGCRYQWQVARDTGIVLLLLDTGVRVSELVGLTLERVVLDSASPYVLVNGKGSKQREIGPLGKR